MPANAKSPHSFGRGPLTKTSLVSQSHMRAFTSSGFSQSAQCDVLTCLSDICGICRAIPLPSRGGSAVSRRAWIKSTGQVICRPTMASSSRKLISRVRYQLTMAAVPQRRTSQSVDAVLLQRRATTTSARQSAIPPCEKEHVGRYNRLTWSVDSIPRILIRIVLNFLHVAKASHQPRMHMKRGERAHLRWENQNQRKDVGKNWTRKRRRSPNAPLPSAVSTAARPAADR